ncbi:MAG: MBL fold metallo-hydrolase [candidate division KSB1 bacterium]|nr:MBL fold metallo-hydrolase [candidate division KSB1 bacterium]
MDKLVLLTLAGFAMLNYTKNEETAQEVFQEEITEPLRNVTLIVTYDNNPYDSRLKTAWGFSCLIKLEGKNILFDTGGDSATLMYNMRQLNLDPKEIDAVVLSHIHGDHVGGLSGILSQNSKVTVIVPESFLQSFKNEVRSHGSRLEEVLEGKKLFDNVYTTGQLGTSIKEQSLILNTKEGLILITGCSHPGIVEIVAKSRKMVKAPLLLVMGGFHLGGKTEEEIKEIIADFKALGYSKSVPATVPEIGQDACLRRLTERILSRLG